MLRPEHPKPQFYRNKWLSLNGEWNFAFDFGGTGVEKGWHNDPSEMKLKIRIPFCPESKLSGVQYTDIIPAVWYHTGFSIPKDWAEECVFIHFGGVDYDCRVWVNGEAIGRHYGGSSSFSFDITSALKEGKNELIVCAQDDIRSGKQPRGKQSPEYMSHNCVYTRTTGIWQSVWLEARAKTHLERVSIVPDLDNAMFDLRPSIANCTRGTKFKATLIAEGKVVSEICMNAASGASYSIDVPDARVWSLSDPFLYDIRFELIQDEQRIDTVSSYGGLRKFHIEGNKFFLNNKPIFLRFVLDQGFYPDGIWTAPSDAELKADIERAMAVGFNGARLHEKVFEERYHYWADKLGFLTWGEFCDWGVNNADPQSVHNHHREWREVVMRDINHPSIIAWTPFNETSPKTPAEAESHRRAVEETYLLTKDIDPTRPVNDTSGWIHGETDIYTIHNYEQNPEVFAKTYADVTPDNRKNFCLHFQDQNPIYKGQPFMVDEYGGTWWEEVSTKEADGGVNHEQSWGYGRRPDNIEEVYSRIEKLTKTLLEHPHISGFCYTQLTDVEQEKNGIYTYERECKFDKERLKRAFGAPTAIEKSN